MNTRPSALERLQLLSNDSRFDLACSCGTRNVAEARRRTELGSWLYPVPLVSGGTGIMVKTLLSNVCSSDCAYCPFRHNGVADHRCSLTPDEMAGLFIEQTRKQWLLGLFLSSGIVGSADHTMELLTDTAAILRQKYSYRGYIHLKVIPGASEAAMDRALSLASCVSLNIETPGARHFRKLSSYKDFDRDIVRPIKYLAEHAQHPAGRKKRVKCTTQFIVGASDETDAEIVRYMGAFYDRLKFHRLFFSAYQDPRIPEEFQLDDGSANVRLDREHRLYQTDFLLRKYGFSSDEIPCGADGRLDPLRDPKQVWADLHPDFYPVRLNDASRAEILRVPGIGPAAADRIVGLRRIHRLREWAETGIAPALALRAMRYAVFS